MSLADGSFWTVAAAGRVTDLHVGSCPPPGFSDSSISGVVVAAAEAAMAERAPVDPEDNSACALILVADEWDSDLAELIGTLIQKGPRLSPLHLMQSVPNGVLGHIAQKHHLKGPIFSLSVPGDDVGHLTSTLDRMLPPGSSSAALCVQLATGEHQDRPEARWYWFRPRIGWP